jgi:uncharacterized protein YcfJ
MNAILRNSLALAALAVVTQASAQVSFYESENFSGRSFSTEGQIANFQDYGFNDRASSAVVAGKQWEICEHAQFGGRCMVLRPGRYRSLLAMGMNDRVSSVRPLDINTRIDESRYAPLPAHNYHRRDRERLFEANVISVRAVVGPPERRCWVEQEQIPEEHSSANVPGAIAGAVIGGILGHQIGGGVGRNLATAGGAVAGAAVGSNIGRADGRGQAGTREVERCADTPSKARPEFWDVTYSFRGQEHQVQMTAPPGATVTVNEQGEPRD